jgi:hypothetical protein
MGQDKERIYVNGYEASRKDQEEEKESPLF